MYCKHCGKEIADDAKFCPGCGKQTGENTAPVFHVDPEAEKKHKKRGCLTWLIIGIMLFGGCVAIFGGSDTAESGNTAPTNSGTIATTEPTTAPTEEPVIEISPSDLYAAYEENEVAADNKYDGKMIRITGIIDDIGKDITDTVYVTIIAGDYDNIQCFFESSEQIENVATLKSGDEVTIVGECGGISILNVLLYDCELE